MLDVLAWRSVEVIAALLLSLLFAPPSLQRPSLHPVRLLYGIVESACRKLNRQERGHGTLQVRGTLLAMFLLMVGLAVHLGWQAASLYWQLVAIAEIGLLSLLLAQRPLLSNRRKPWEITPVLWGYVTFLPPEQEVRDAPAKRRLAVESMVAYFAMHTLYSIFWFILGGISGLVASYLLLILQAAVKEQHEGDRAFSETPRLLFTALSFIPMRLATALLLLGGMFVPGCRVGAGMAEAWHFVQRHPLGRGGALAATAGMLDLSLGGHSPVAIARGYDWLGKGRARTEPIDTARMWWLYVVSLLLLLLLLAVAAYGLLMLRK